MTDYIIRASAANHSVRAFIATTKDLVAHAHKIHHTSPLAAAALGRLLTASAMMGFTLKNETDLLTLSIKGDGNLGGVVATTNHHCEVKGYVHNAQAALLESRPGKFDIGTSIGLGTLTVTKDLGLKEPVSGTTELVSGEIAEDLTYYFASSEQTPSSVALGVLMNTDNTVAQAGGYIIQLMPDAGEDIINHLENVLPALPSITQLLTERNAPEDILNKIFEGFEPQILDKIHPVFKCNCSREKAERALISTGTKELRALLDTDKTATLHCHFCNTDYVFSENDLKSMLKALLEGLFH